SPTDPLRQKRVESGPRCCKVFPTVCSNSWDKGLPSKFQMPEIPLMTNRSAGKSNGNIGKIARRGTKDASRNASVPSQPMTKSENLGLLDFPLRSVLTCLSGLWPAQLGISTARVRDWQLVMEAAARHGVTPVVFSRFQ